MSTLRTHLPTLGSFALEEEIGAGGMGAVWKGRHQRSGRPVALKVLLPHFASSPKYLEGFHREVRATARLHHPGIVPVFDHGMVTEAAAILHKDLKEGSLWLAMEFIEGGSLEDHQPITTWQELQDLLLQLLDALAHSHARELVHRDLKPANVLRRVDPQGRIRWLLTDFGIAHVTDPSVSARTADVEGLTAGTPYFMAPEQLHGKWRDYGPWTDLYALGCMAFLLVTGRPPFDGESLMSIALQHLSDPPPPLAPRFAVPPGFENWVRRLLEKDVALRYRHCADAAGDLLRLGAPEGQDFDFAAPESHEALATLATLAQAPELYFQSTQLLDDQSLRSHLVADQRPDPTGTFQAVTLRQIQPPATWRRDESHRTEALQGTGKGIFRFRQIPFSGRLPERDHIWNEFHRISSQRQPRAVVIEGPPGLGKSSLAAWISTRANELGLSHSLLATHSPIMSATEGLPRMFQAFLSATGLQRRPLFDRLDASISHFSAEPLDDEFLAALVEWMHPAGAAAAAPNDGVPVITLESPLERYTLAERLLRLITAERPVVLTIDDGQWAQDSLGFVRYLLASSDPRPLPVLILISLRADGLKGRLVESEFFQLIAEHSATTTIPLGPLSEEDQRSLIGGSLGLAPSLVHEVGTGTGGNPLFAIQLIEDWLDREALLEGDEGYILTGDEEFPADLSGLLSIRLQRFFDELPDADTAQQQAEAAAALGVEFETAEWANLCQTLGAPLRADLQEHLTLTGVLLVRDHGWRFRLPMYRDVLATRSQQARRWESINLACARTVQVGAENGTCLAERRGRYFLAAGHHDKALPLFWAAIRNRMQRSAYIQVDSLLLVVTGILDAMENPPDDPVRSRILVLRAEALRYRGDFAGSKDLLNTVLDWPQDLPTPYLAHAHRVFGSLCTFQGHLHEAVLHYREAFSLFEDLDDYSGMAKSLHGMGWCHTLLNDLDAARASFQAGYERAVQAEDHLEAAWCLHGVCEASYFSGKHSEAEHLAHSVLDLFLAEGCRSGIALTYRNIGDIHRHRGETDLARQNYRRARHLALATGHVMAHISAGFLGLCELTENHLEEARRLFTILFEVPGQRLFPFFRALGPLGLLAVAAEQRDRPRFDEILPIVESLLVPGSPIQQDFILLLKRAHAACLQNQWTPQAQSTSDLLTPLLQHHS